MNDTTKRRIGLAIALVVIGASILALEAPWREGSTVPDAPDDIPESALAKPAAPNFAGATGWVDSEPVDLVELRGQVVLVDFWTYSCINCIHTFPYINAWHDEYADDGLVIVGVHTPEFRFERDAENVRDAMQRYGLEHAVAQDNDYEIWKAYHNRYWPAKYLIDQWGRIQYTHFGEGRYEETEQVIRDLLEDAGAGPFEGPLVATQVDPEGGYSSRGQTPELYAGAAQGMSRVGIGNEEGYEPGKTITYARPDEVPRDAIYLVGTWYNDRDHVRAVANASVLLRFQAGAANFVADGPSGSCVPVMLDGAAFPDDRAARDVTHVDADTTCITIDDPRSYDFYAGPVEEHLFEMDVPEGFELYSFAFSRDGRR